MKESVYIVFGILSFFALIAAVCFAIKAYKGKDRGKRVLSSLHIFTLGVFISTVLIFIPVYYVGYDFGDSYAVVRPLLISIHHAFRVFILDGEFDTIRDAVKEFGTVIHVLFSLYAGLLYVLAPILTFSNVLSLFKNIKNEVRFSWHKKRPFYIFSELNERSIVLAESLIKTKKGERPVVVFTDVFEKNEERDYELLLKAHDINSICLKKDISRLKIKGKKSKAEFFFIGESEEENVRQAAAIAIDLDRYGKKQNVKLFVFASGKENGCVIDSLNYDALLDRAMQNGFGEDTFKIRRVDSIRQFVWKAVPNMRLFKSSDNGVISVMIAGMGSYGIEFFKMLVWYCQAENYKLELNVFDKKSDSTAGQEISSILSRQCPELMNKNPSFEDGDSRYDIRCYSGVDFETDQFEKLLKVDDRLKRTTAVIVTLGDDNKNIELATYLRTVFDREKHIIADNKIGADSEVPLIYAVVYDSTKSGLVGKDNAEFLKNYKDIPYHIDFIGALENQYSYDNVYDCELESKAFAYHAEWAKINYELMQKIEKSGFALDEKDMITYDGRVMVSQETLDKLLSEKKKYEKYEYYRLSSMSRALYCDHVSKYNTHLEKMEHCRWNAYMRSNGYVYGKRSDRALQHNDLITWKELLGRNDGSESKDKNI